MNVSDYRTQIRCIIPVITCYTPEDTILGKASRTAYDMVRAYTNDGTLFLSQGDPVNAIASFGYAQGWLDGGKFLGLMKAPSLDIDLEETFENSVLKRLQERVRRYHLLLREGLMAVEPAPDRASILWQGADGVFQHAESAFGKGKQQCSEKRPANALRWFGYGHGWLDVGARTGLFRIKGRRDLFTL